MTRTQIETWALRIIEQVTSGRPSEDSTAEAKSKWPAEHAKAARQVAAHANAAHGEPILWVIGLDEGNRAVVGAEAIEVADWWAQVKAQFDEVSPDMTPVNVVSHGKTTCALLFTTDRAPYVVRHPSGNDKVLDVPWRDGNSTRSANRHELLRLLTPAAFMPDFEVLEGRLSAAFKSEHAGKEPDRVDWHVWLLSFA